MNIKLIAGSSNKKLAIKIANAMKQPLVDCKLSQFSDGETEVEINENVRGCDVYIIQSLSKPVNDNLIELILMADALQRADVDCVTAVIPYYGYGRQDKKVRPRVPISAKRIANLIQTTNIRRIVTLDLHAGQIQGFFDIPVDNLFASYVFLPHILQNYNSDEICIVSPDPGGFDRAKAYASRLGCDVAVIYKKRKKPNQVDESSSRLISENEEGVRGKICISIDDIIDTAGTLNNAAKLLKKFGARKVISYATHGVLSGPAKDRIISGHLDKLIIADTIISPEWESDNIKVLSISDLLSKAITRIHKREPVSILFLNGNIKAGVVA